MKTYEQYLRDSAVTKKVIDVFLDRSQATWAQYDPELGYTLGNSMPHDGLDGCWTISTAQPNGARTSHVFAGKPCRINTYGDSFTQCHQVSDAETWQEYLAGHLGEPIRNFGMGGYGFYQAYRRLVRTEQGSDQAKYVLLYLWGDDHLRSAMRCRYAVCYPWWDNLDGRAFHNPFWANIEMDLRSQKLVEKPNLLPTPESLYRMTEPDFMAEALKDDLMVQLCVAEQVEPSSLDLAALNALAEILRVPGIRADSAEKFQASAARLKQAYGFAATRHILDLAFGFCQAHGKELMILLLCPSATWNLLQNEPRYDQEIVAYLEQHGRRYFDMNRIHAEDFKSFRISPEDYLKRYYIGHYGPAGNHFFAYSLKNKMVEWMDPKPVTYRGEDNRVVGFHGYLHGEKRSS